MDRGVRSLDFLTMTIVSLDNALFLGFLTAINASIGRWNGCGCGCGGGGLVKGRGSAELLVLALYLSLSLLALRTFLGSFLGVGIGIVRRGAEVVLAVAAAGSEYKSLEVEK